MKQYGKIIWVNLRHHFLPMLAAAAGLVVLTFLLFNITALQGREAARPIEFLLCWAGVLLLTPVFLPEQNKEIRDVIRSRKKDYLEICVLRVAYSVLAIIMLVVMFLGVMKQCESDVTGYHVFGGIATALFFGAVGFAAAGISDNVTVGYMAAMLYYLLNYGAKEWLGKFWLFSMSAGEMQDKEWLLGGAVVLIVLTFVVMRRKQRR